MLVSDVDKPNIKAIVIAISNTGVWAVNVISKAIELAKSFGPTEADREKFGATWLGSSLSQTVILVGLVLTYIAVVVALWALVKDQLTKCAMALVTLLSSRF